MWTHFLRYVDAFRGKVLYAEQLLQIPFQGQLLSAKFDLLVELEGMVLIVDWKTSSSKPPLPHLAERVQTYLYPFLLVESGTGLFPTGQIDPASIQFSYWYPLCAEPEVSFRYSPEQHLAVEARLRGIVEQIRAYQASDPIFPLTGDRTQCQFCPYRSLCDRGSRAGDFDLLLDPAEVDWSEMHFDLEQISELEF